MPLSASNRFFTSLLTDSIYIYLIYISCVARLNPYIPILGRTLESLECADQRGRRNPSDLSHSYRIRKPFLPVSFFVQDCLFDTCRRDTRRAFPAEQIVL